MMNRIMVCNSYSSSFSSLYIGSWTCFGGMNELESFLVVCVCVAAAAEDGGGGGVTTTIKTTSRQHHRQQPTCPGRRATLVLSVWSNFGPLVSKDTVCSCPFFLRTDLRVVMVLISADLNKNRQRMIHNLRKCLDKGYDRLVGSQECVVQLILRTQF